MAAAAESRVQKSTLYAAAAELRIKKQRLNSNILRVTLHRYAYPPTQTYLCKLPARIYSRPQHAPVLQLFRVHRLRRIPVPVLREPVHAAASGAYARPDGRQPGRIVQLTFVKMNFIEKKTFEKTNFSEQPFDRAEYESCVFDACDFTGADASGAIFTRCVFRSCNLSMANLSGTSFQNAVFRDCKLTGTDFEPCSRFGLSMSFEGCVLSYASFYRMRLPKTVFRSCNLADANFAECDLSQSVFDRSDLTRAVFSKTKLEKADLRTAYNYSLDPSDNMLRKARFSSSGIAGLLVCFGISIED